MPTKRRSKATLCVLTVLALGGPGVTYAGVDSLPDLHEHFVRGDVNQDGAIEISDGIALLSYLFSGGTAECLDAADLNDDEAVNVADAVSLLDYLFQAGAPPPAPNVCGPDPTLPVHLSCNSFAPCESTTSRGLAGHLLRRLGYGATEDRLAYVMSIGADAYLDEQLHPELDDELDNVALQDAIVGLDPSASPLALIQWQVLHALYSRNQLREAQVDFWENHFNTDLSKQSQLLRNIRVAGQPIYTPQEAAAEATLWEWQENETFRTEVFGDFGDLLTASATSKNMISYLDGYLNQVGAPNENYARELLELHTMGVDNGYTQQDIEEVARCFTGWTVRKHAPGTENDPHAPPVPFNDPTGIWSFHFASVDHDYDAKTIFAGTSYELVIPARAPLSDDGLLDGFEVLEHLATLPQTAEFVSTKLIQKYVSDEPPLDLIADCLGTWLATDGDMLAIMTTILTSDHFRARENRWNKVRTPFEFIVSTSRAVDAGTNGLPLIAGVSSPNYGLIGLDQRLFFYETPEGQSELGFDWMGATSMLNRILFAHYLLLAGNNPSTAPVVEMQQAGVDLTSTTAVADYWLTRVYQHGYDADARTLAVSYLSTDANGVAAPLDPADTIGYRERIRAFVGFVLSAPLGSQQ